MEPFDPELRVSGEGLPEFNDSFQKAYLAAPPEVQLKLRQVRNAHFGAGGVEGVLKNLGGQNDRGDPGDDAAGGQSHRFGRTRRYFVYVIRPKLKALSSACRRIPPSKTS